MTSDELRRFRASLKQRRDARGFTIAELEARYVLDGRTVRALRDRLALANEDLYLAVGVQPRLFDCWIADVGRRLRPWGEQATLLAEVLGTSLSSITRPGEEDEIVDEDLPDAVPARARIGVLREYWRLLGWYRRHLGRRWVVPGCCLHEFAHDGRARDYYAEVVVTPEVWPHLDPVRYVFAFRTPGMRGALQPVGRIDYGEVTVFPSGLVELASSFQSQESVAQTDRFGTFKVWTWFGAEPCDFHVRSREPFALEAHVERAIRDPAALGAHDGVVYFTAAPHHRRRA